MANCTLHSRDGKTCDVEMCADDGVPLADLLSRLINSEDDSINAHVWVETVNGTVVDVEFQWDQVERRSHGCSDEIVLVEYPPHVKKALWEHVWKRCIRPTVEKNRQLGCTEDEFWAEVLAHPWDGGCMFHAYAYHRAHPKTTMLKFGALGYRRSGSGRDDVVWRYGTPLVPQK